jgi:hypothetical protein
MVYQPNLFSPKLGTMSLNFFRSLRQNFVVKPGIHNLARWDKFFTHNPLDVKESDDYALEISFHLSGFSSFGDVELFHWEDCRFVSGS